MAASVAASNGGTYSGTGPTVTLASAPAAGRVLLALVSTTNTAALGAGVAGWDDPGTGLVTPGDTTCYLTAVVHVVTSGEAAASTTSWDLSGLWGSSETGEWWLYDVTGADSADPIGGAGSWFQVGTDDVHGLAEISGTGLPADCLVLRTVISDGASLTYTTPSGHTKLRDGGTNNGGWMGYRDTLTTAGTAVPEEPITVSTGDEGLSISVAIKSAAGGAQASAAGGLAITGAATGTAAGVIAAGTIALTGAATARGAATAAGSLTLTGAATARGAATAAGGLTVTGAATGTAAGVNTAAGSLAITGNATATAPATAAGTLAVTGTAQASGRGAATGGLTIAGAASASSSGASTASGSLTVTGTAVATAQATAAGTVTITGVASARGAATAFGAIVIAGLAFPGNLAGPVHAAGLTLTTTPAGLTLTTTPGEMELTP